MSPSTVTFVYWLLTGAGGLLFLSPFEDDLLKRFLQNSFAADSFFTVFAAPSLLLLSPAACSLAEDPAPEFTWLSILFIVIVITKFGFTSLCSCRFPSCISIKRISDDFQLQSTTICKETFSLVKIFTTVLVHIHSKTEPLKTVSERASSSHSHLFYRIIIISWRGQLLGKYFTSTALRFLFSLS